MDFYQIGLFSFIRSHKNAFEAKDGIIISVTDDDKIRVEKELELSGDRTCKLYKFYNLFELEEGIAVNTIMLTDFDEEGFLNSGGLTFLDIVDLEIGLTFRLTDDVTFVYSLADHFCDEVAGELERFEQYTDYLNSREGLFYTVYECRNKYWNSSK